AGGALELGAAEQRAAVPTRALPVERTLQQARVLPEPPIVGVESQGKSGGGVELLVAEGDPLDGTDVLRRESCVDRPEKKWNKSLVALTRPPQLLRALGRRDPSWAQHDHEDVGLIDSPGDLRFPLGRRRDALPIRPDLSPLLLEQRVETERPLSIGTRV